jgi:hypothetical protein
MFHLTSKNRLGLYLSLSMAAMRSCSLSNLFCSLYCLYGIMVCDADCIQMHLLGLADQILDMEHAAARSAPGMDMQIDKHGFFQWISLIF